jgi:hypothetical protein
MAAFDAPAREACTVFRSRTNTPLQALALLNDVTFVEAARALAGRVLREEKTAEARLRRAFRLAAGRTPRPAELAILKAGLDGHLAHYRKDKAAARKLVAVGDSKPEPSADVAELAAYTAVAGLVLNLDEVITRE